MFNLVLSLLLFFPPFLSLGFWQCQLPSLQPGLVLDPKNNFSSWWLSWVPATLLSLCFPICVLAACALQPLNLMAGLHVVWKVLQPPHVSCCWCRAAQPFLGRSSYSFGAYFCFPLPLYHCYGESSTNCTGFPPPAVPWLPNAGKAAALPSSMPAFSRAGLEEEDDVERWGWSAGPSCWADRQSWCCRQGLLCRVSLAGP